MEMKKPIECVLMLSCIVIKAKHLINRNIQIYTKRGNVEIPLNGRMSDFENAILLHKVNLNETNALIQVRVNYTTNFIRFFQFNKHVEFTGGWKEKIESDAKCGGLPTPCPMSRMETQRAKNED